MKKLQSIDAYLLKNYPLLWNTKIVWVLLIGFIFHIFFYLMGFLSINVEDLKQETFSYFNPYFDTGFIYIGIIISILLLLVWIVYFLRNNAFKNFYTFSRNKLFFLFSLILCILFVCSSFYLSFILGFTQSIQKKYPIETIKKEIELANIVGAFLPYSIYNYTIDNRNYPEIFENLQVEKTRNFADIIDIQEPYLFDSQFYYQFFTTQDSLIKLDCSQDDDIHKTLYEFYKKKYGNKFLGLQTLEHCKEANLQLIDSFYDVHSYFKTLKPSFYNFKSGYTQFTSYKIFDHYNLIGYQTYSKFSVDSLYNKTQYTLLETQDSVKIKSLMHEFLDICKKHNIQYNMPLEAWYKMVFNPASNYTVQSIIYNSIYKNNSGKIIKQNYYNDETIETIPDEIDVPHSQQQNRNITNRNTIDSPYYSIADTNYFLNSTELNNVFQNVVEFTYNDLSSTAFLIIFWISFAISVLLFIFKTTSIKTLLLTSVFTLLLLLFFSLCGVFMQKEYYIFSFIGMVLFLFLLSGIFFSYKGFKTLKSILASLTIIIFPIWLLIMYILVNLYHSSYNLDNIEDMYFFYNVYQVSTFIFIATMVFYYFYFQKIKLWRAMPN